MTEDLAPEVYTRLKQIRNLPSINKCWSVVGKIKYVMNESIVRVLKNERDVELVVTWKMVNLTNNQEQSKELNELSV